MFGVVLSEPITEVATTGRMAIASLAIGESGERYGM
jgi:hypothetical protein